MSILNTNFVQKPYTLNRLVTEPLEFSIPVLRPFLSQSPKHGRCFDLGVRHFVYVTHMRLCLCLKITAKRLYRLVWNLETTNLLQRWSDVCVRICFFPSRFKMASVLWVFFAVVGVDRSLLFTFSQNYCTSSYEPCLLTLGRSYFKMLFIFYYTSIWSTVYNN